MVMWWISSVFKLRPYWYALLMILLNISDLVIYIFILAAHCNDSKHNGMIKFVKLGMIDRLQNDNNVFIYNVTKVIKHPQYSPRTFDNDIALLKLENDVNFSEFIYPICLPTRQHNEPNVILTGLGKTGGSDEQSQKLMKVELRKFSNKECQEIIETINITRNMMCYGSRVEQKDSCGVRSRL